MRFNDISNALVALLAMLSPPGPFTAGTIDTLKGAYKTVTIEVESASIESVLRSVLDPAVAVTFNNLDADRRIAVKFQDTPRDQALATLAYNLDLFYSVSSPKTLVVTQWSHLSRQPALVPRTQGMGVPRRVSGSAPRFPEIARRARFEGRILVRMTITSSGGVRVGEMLRCDLNSASHGPSEKYDEEICPLFHSAVSEALAEWRFEPMGQDAEYDAQIGFKLR